MSDNWGTGKRPLTEVKEEPQEKDEDYEMVGGAAPYDIIPGELWEFSQARAISTPTYVPMLTYN